LMAAANRAGDIGAVGSDMIYFFDLLLGLWTLEERVGRKSRAKF